MISSADATVLEFLEQVYMNKPTMAAGSTNTHADYRTQVGHFTSYFRRNCERCGRDVRDPRVSDLSEELVEGAMAWRLSLGVTAPTANKVGRVIYALWSYAWRKRLLDVQPRREFFREPDQIPEAWWIEEFRQIVHAARQTPGYVGDVQASTWWPALLLLVYNTGARISAVMSIRVEWIDFRRGSLSIYHHVQKDRADQVVQLLPETLAAIQELRPQRLDRLFDDWPYDRAEPSWRALTYHYRKILKRAGLRDDRDDLFHKIRRTFATYIAAASGEVMAQQMLGHSHISVTRRYIDPRKLNQPSAKDLLPRVSAGQMRLFMPETAG